MGNAAGVAAVCAAEPCAIANLDCHSLCTAFLSGRVGSGKTCVDLGVADYGGVVIDEIVAMWLVLAAAPLTMVGWAAAFVLFRIFDIAKPWPINWLDARIPGGVGVMLDYPKVRSKPSKEARTPKTVPTTPILIDS